MTIPLQLSLPLTWSHHRSYMGIYHPFPTQRVLLVCALSKQGQRFFTSLSTSSATDDPLVTNRLIRKFVGSSSKSVALNALTHLLEPSASRPYFSSLALPFYCVISKESWFSWNPKLAADVIALLYKHGKLDEVNALIAEAVSKFEHRERELCNFYCFLIDSHSKHKSKEGVFDSYRHLKQLLSGSSSVHLRRQTYESMIGGLCILELPREAENIMEEMKGLGSSFKPSVFVMRSIVYAYGRLGLFQDMKRSVLRMESEGFKKDSVCLNMVLSSLGAHSELSDMVLWLQRMKNLGVPLTVRTCNTVLNSCQTIMSMLQDTKSIPLSIEELLEGLPDNESVLVHELIESSVLVEAMEQTSSELKLDLHGMHLSTAYLIILQWFDELRIKFLLSGEEIPAEITVVCGSGKHSSVRGESPVKHLVKEIMVRTESPMRIDRKNIGCFVAKGTVCKRWLC